MEYLHLSIIILVILLTSFLYHVIKENQKLRKKRDKLSIALKHIFTLVVMYEEFFELAKTKNKNPLGKQVECHTRLVNDIKEIREQIEQILNGC